MTTDLKGDVLTTLAMIPAEGNFLINLKVRRTIVASGKQFYARCLQMCRPCVHYWMLDDTPAARFMDDATMASMPWFNDSLLHKLAYLVTSRAVVLDGIELCALDTGCDMCARRLKAVGRMRKMEKRWEEVNGDASNT